MLRLHVVHNFIIMVVMGHMNDGAECPTSWQTEGKWEIHYVEKDGSEKSQNNCPAQ